MLVFRLYAYLSEVWTTMLHYALFTTCNRIRFAIQNEFSCVSRQDYISTILMSKLLQDFLAFIIVSLERGITL